MSNAAPVLETDFRTLRAMIARRKAMDAVFALLGIALVVASLTVLVVLFGQLVRDGTARLTATHLVKRDGFAPGRFDLIGRLERTGDSSGAAWVLARDPLILGGAGALQNELSQLDGKAVLVEGDLPSPGRTKMDLNGIAPASSPKPETFSRTSIHGILKRRGNEWIIEPSSIPLDLSEVQTDYAAMAGQIVAIEPKRSKSLPLSIRSVDALRTQGFFNSMPSREAERAGIKSALVGSILVVSVTMLLAVPLGVAAGLYLEEYGRKNWLTGLIEINIANLAGVPSIVWGLMALGLFVYYFGLGRSILTAGMTLGLLVLPIVIMATREAVRAIPQGIREASYACGASKWQTVRYHVIPYSMSGILTGSIIGLSRAIGETAPLITIGALTYIAFLPGFSWSSPLAWIKSEFTVMPIQMFNWISRPDRAFHENAAAAGIVLLVLTLSMNAIAIVLRYRLRQRIKW